MVSLISFHIPPPPTEWVHVWRISLQAYDRDYLLPTVMHGGESVMVWELSRGFLLAQSNP